MNSQDNNMPIMSSQSNISYCQPSKKELLELKRHQKISSSRFIENVIEVEPTHE